MKIVLVLNVKIPATDISIGHVVSAKLGRLYVNNIFFAAGIFVANFYGRGGNTVNSLEKKYRNCTLIKVISKYAQIRISKLRTLIMRTHLNSIHSKTITRKYAFQDIASSIHRVL